MVKSSVLSEQLTGNWYLKKTLFGWLVKVEVEQLTMNNIDFSVDPAFRFYRNANESELKKLKINFKK